MITVQLSDDEKLILPQTLGRRLGLSEGDRVQVGRLDNVLWFRRRGALHTPGPLTDLARIVSSSRPVGSVDIEEYMDKRGYEQLDERGGL